MKRVSVINLKGGVSKTLTAYSLATQLSKQGSTILVDLDPQQTAADLYKLREDITNLELIALSRTHLEARLASIAGYDFMVTDTPPALSVQMAAAIDHSDLVIVPIKPGYGEYYALERMGEQLARANETGKVIILLTQTNNTTLSKTFREAMNDSGYPVLNTELKQRVTYSESLREGLNAIEFAPGSIAALELRTLTREIMEYLK